MAFHSKLNPELNFARCLSRAKAAGKTLAQPRAGAADLNSHLELLLFLQGKGEADLLPTTIDSYTRQNRYEEAEKALAESIREGRSLLNGFPAVNWVASCRRLVEGWFRLLQVATALQMPACLRRLPWPRVSPPSKAGAFPTIFPTPSAHP